MADIRHARKMRDVFDAEFFVLRSPLLPFSEFLDWSQGISKPRADAQSLHEAWTNDVALLRSRLRSILERPEIAHALLVASPSLESGIEHWKRDPDSKKGLQAERALVRYFERMSSRPTPFGIFAGYSLGTVDRQSNVVSLDLPGREEYRTCTRLDFEYLFALTSALHRDTLLIKDFTYYPNSSLHRVADAWHFVESRLVEGELSYHLAKLAADDYLNAVLLRAQRGAGFAELAEAVLEKS